MLRADPLGGVRLRELFQGPGAAGANLPWGVCLSIEVFIYIITSYAVIDLSIILFEHSLKIFLTITTRHWNKSKQLKRLFIP